MSQKSGMSAVQIRDEDGSMVGMNVALWKGQVSTVYSTSMVRNECKSKNGRVKRNGRDE